MPLDPTQELTRARDLLAEAEAQTQALRQIVALWEQALGGGGIPNAETVETLTIGLPERPRRVPRGGNPKGREATKGLKTLIADVMADGKRRNVDAVMEEVAERAEFGKPPKRVSFTNRLNDLVKDGTIRVVERGVYELASTSDTAHADGAGTDQADPPSQASQLEGGEDGSSGGLDRPPDGPPVNGATAGAARRT